MWNAFQLGAGVAWGLHLPNSELDRRQSSGVQTWLVGAMPLGPVGGPAKLMGQATYTRESALADRVEADVLGLGARVLIGSPLFHGFLEVTKDHRSGASNGTDGAHHGWSGGIEFRLTNGLWLSAGFGNRYNELDAAEQTFLIADLQWSGSQQSRLGDIGGGRYGN
jgi:hypothetical protein